MPRGILNLLLNDKILALLNNLVIKIDFPYKSQVISLKRFIFYKKYLYKVKNIYLVGNKLTIYYQNAIIYGTRV